MTLEQLAFILEGQTTRTKIMKCCEWLQEGLLDEIRVWGIDSLQDAETQCFVKYNKKEKVWEGQYSLGFKSKWVSPFQVHQYIDKNFLTEVDITGVTMYKNSEAITKLNDNKLEEILWKCLK